MSNKEYTVGKLYRPKGLELFAWNLSKKIHRHDVFALLKHSHSKDGFNVLELEVLLSDGSLGKILAQSDRIELEEVTKS